MLQPRPLSRASLVLTCTLALACAGNGDEEPRPSPAPDPTQGEASILSVSPRSGDPGTEVTIRAGGFAPDATVDLGFGPPQSEYDVLTTARTDASGEVAATVAVPSWAERGGEYLFVVAGQEARTKAVSRPFLVTTAAGGVRVEGEVTDEGVECLAIKSRSGELYTLAGGDTEGLETGDRVTVEGTVAEVSFCQQGTTLEVSRVERRGP